MSTISFLLAAAASAVVSYLLGSVNCAIIVSRVIKKDDVRNHGSGNAGMTNILRTYGKRMAAATAAGDFLKAILAIIFARWMFGRFCVSGVDAGYIAGIFVILGHVYPLYFRFRGGKGVMTTLGVMFLVNPIVFLIIVIVFVPLVFITKIVSLSSVLGAIVFPVLTYAVAVWRGDPAVLNTAFALVYTVVVLVMHRENIKRLLSGTEHKFGQNDKKKD